MSKRHDSTSSSDDSDGSSSDSSSTSDSSSDDQRQRRMRSTVSVKQRVNSKSPATRRSPGEREPAHFEPRSPSTSPDRSRREPRQRSQSPIKDDSPKRSSVKTKKDSDQQKSKRHDSESDGSDSPRKESRSSSKRTRETRSSQSPEVQEKRARRSRNGVDSRNGDRGRSRAESDEESRHRQGGYSSRRRDYDRNDDRYSQRDYQDRQGRYRGRSDDRDRSRNDYGDRRRERYEGTDYGRSRDRRGERGRREEDNSRNDDDKSYSRKRRGEEDPGSVTGPAVSDKDDADYLKSKRAKTGGDEEILTTRTGGAYIPPARLRMMQAQITDKSSVQFQRIAWEALKKSLNGLINKVNVSNIVFIVRELFQENIVRGRGLLTRSIIQAQAASPTFTHVYAALVAIINTKFPQIGELLLKRLALQFRKGFKRNNKDMCLSSVRFVAHLVNQQVAHEIIALEILTLLLENPTDDSVEVAVGFLKESGQKLSEVSPRGIHAIFERLRTVLHEGQIDKRTQYMVEVMFAVRKDGFKDHPAVVEELDVVDEQDQFTHMLTLDDAVSAEEMLNVFKVDPEYEDNEEKYKVLKREILEEDSSDEDGSGSGDSGSDDDSDSSEEDGEEAQVILDQTETNMVALRRTIYLTIQSSLDFEECAHKLLKMELKPGQEVELCNMVLDCCAQQRTYEKFFGLLAQRFCMIDKKYVEPYQNMFVEQYETIHRLETNKLRNVGKFFAHLLHTDAISWEVLQHIHLNEDDTTSSSRIFIKILFQELSEYMGLPKLNDRLKDMTLQAYFEGLFPRDNPKNTRFAINFFTSIGLGGLTDELRAHLKTMPKAIMQQQQQVSSSSSSSSESSSDSESSSSSDSSSSDSDSSSEEEEKRSWRKTAKSAKSSHSEKRRKSHDSGRRQRGLEGQDKHRDARSRQRDAEDDDSDTAHRKPGWHHRGDDRRDNRRDKDIRSKEHRDIDVKRERGHRDNDITEHKERRSRRHHDDNSFESHKETRSKRRDADDSDRGQDSQFSRYRDDGGESRRNKDSKAKKPAADDDDEDDLRAYKERTSRRYQDESIPEYRGREKVARLEDSHSRPKEKKSRREKSRNSPKRDESKKAKSKKSRREELEERIERIDIRLERRYRKVRSEDRDKGKKEKRREERYRSP